MTAPRSPSLAARATNLFTVLYCLSTVNALFDEAAAALGFGHPLALVRNALSVATIGVAALLYVAMAITTRLSKRIVLPPIFVAFWITFGALPFTLVAPAAAGLIAAGVQALAAAYLLLALRQRYGSLRMTESEPGPSFRLAASLGFVAANVVLVPIFGVALAAVSLGSYIQTTTHGFVSFDRTGINLAERRYVRDDRTIRLVGMMHIGERSSYDELFQSFAVENTVVLEEGVTDANKRLETFGYAQVASSLGLDVQPHLEDVYDRPEGEDDDTPASDSWPHIEHADLDVSDFQPDTIVLLNRIGYLWSLPEPLQQWRELLAIANEPGADKLPELFNSDLIDKRNRNLLAHLRTALETYRIVAVPWGGLHLPGIEREILTWGFVPQGSSSRRLLRYRTILEAVLARV